MRDSLIECNFYDLHHTCMIFGDNTSSMKKLQREWRDHMDDKDCDSSSDEESVTRVGKLYNCQFYEGFYQIWQVQAILKMSILVNI